MQVVLRRNCLHPTPGIQLEAGLGQASNKDGTVSILHQELRCFNTIFAGLLIEFLTLPKKLPTCI